MSKIIKFFRATEECQAFMSDESNKDNSGSGKNVDFDPLDDSLLRVKV